MSLSSQYLEELSRRYKKQVEEMQRLLEKTLITFQEETKRREEKINRLEEQLNTLTNIVETLVTEKNSWINATYWLFLVLAATVGILTFCRRNTDHKQYADNLEATVEVKRRKSIDVVRHKAPKKKTRRPSEEALKIRGSYQHLMVGEGSSKRQNKDKKRRKKKQSIIRSNSFATLREGVETSDFNKPSVLKMPEDETEVIIPVKKTWARQESAPPLYSSDWVDGNARRVVEDIPFALDECENSGLENLPVKATETKDKALDQPNGSIFSHLRHFSTSSFMRTAREARLSRNSSITSSSLDQNKPVNGNSYQDEKLPSPLSSIEDSSINNTSKKEKKNGFRRIFRKVF